jgi:hypothetical protein
LAKRPENSDAVNYLQAYLFAINPIPGVVVASVFLQGGLSTLINADTVITITVTDIPPGHAASRPTSVSDTVSSVIKALILLESRLGLTANENAVRGVPLARVAPSRSFAIAREINPSPTVIQAVVLLQRDLRVSAGPDSLNLVPLARVASDHPLAFIVQKYTAPLVADALVLFKRHIRLLRYPDTVVLVSLARIPPGLRFTTTSEKNSIAFIL